MSHEIAIVGISCRFPGADHPRAFWDLLSNSLSAISEVPPSRWDVARFYDPDPDVPGKANTKWGGFLLNPGGCDHAFFNLSAEEAVHVDPQQRLILELGWEALEDAAIAPESLKGKQVGVYVGISHNDYERIIYQRHDRITQYHGTGSYQSVAAARLSYFLNVTGPSMAIDTACSSVLSALHVACNALRQDSLPLALVGGVTLHLTPDETIGLTKGHMLSGEGRCKSFDESADGYVRGEGGGVLVLKRLEDAVRDGDHLYGVIKGTAVNHNGRSNGLSAPSGVALKKVMEQALSSAGLQPGEVSLIEAHGTGTRLGDQIELRAIREVYDSALSEPLWLGCCKTNIGHLETASGMASIVKVLLAMRHRSVAPNLHFKGNGLLADKESSRLHVPTSLMPWRSLRELPVAAITAYGFGGANGHALIEAPRSEALVASGAQAPQLLCLSARDEAALRALADSYVQWMGRGEASRLEDVCYTAAVGRNHFEWRAAFVADDVASLRLQLQAVAGSRRAARVLRPSLWFASQWPRGVADDLAATVPLYAQHLSEVCAALRVQWEQCTLAQQTYVAQYALAQMLRSLGVTMAGFAGEGAGSLAAAAQAGRMTLEEGFAGANDSTDLRAAPGLAGPVLAVGTGGGIPAEGVAYRLFSEERAGSARTQLLQMLAELYQLGAKIDWSVWYTPGQHRKLSLPTYPFQRVNMWFTLNEPQNKSTISDRKQQIEPALPLTAHAAAEDVSRSLATEPSARAAALCDWLRDYARSRLDSRSMDERRCIPPHVIQDLGNAGLMGLLVPTRFGGLGLSVRDSLQVFEQTGAIDITLGSFLGVHNVLGTLPILESAPFELQQTELPKLAAGKTLGAFAITERGAGSNPRSIACAARPMGKGLSLDGHKIWIGSGAWAGVISVFANEFDAAGRSLGISGFAVSGRAPGLAQGPEALTMGVRAMVQNELIFNGVQVGNEQRLGQCGAGMEVARNAFHLGRLGIGAMAVGAMKRCVQMIERYSARRMVSTGLLGRNAVYLNFLNDSLSRIEAVEAWVNTGGCFRDAGIALPDEFYAIAKIAGAEHLWQVVDGTLQFAGGRGYIESNVIPQIFRDARLLRIFEGPSEALLAFIGSAHLKGQRRLLDFLRQHLNGVAVTQLEDVTLRLDVVSDDRSRLNSGLLAHAVGHLLCDAALWSIAEHKGDAALERWAAKRFERAAGRALTMAFSTDESGNEESLHARATRITAQIGDVDQRDFPMDELLRAHQADVAKPSTPSPVLPAFPEEPAPNGHGQWLLQLIAKKAQVPVDDLDLDMPFHEYGFDSVDTVEVAHDMESRLGRDMDPTILWNYPTPRALLDFLSSPPTAHRSQSRSDMDDDLMEALRREIAAS